MKEIIYGFNPIIEVIKVARRKIYGLYISRDRQSKRVKELESLAGSKSIPVKHIDYPLIKGVNSQGMELEVSEYVYTGLEQFIEDVDKSGVVLVLDRIVDPHNLGAILRTALLMGVNNIAITRHHSLGINSTVCRSSSGATEHLSITLVNSITQFLADLKDIGFKIGVADKAGEALYKIDFKVKLAIVLGSEGEGVRDIVKSKADFLISVPQNKVLDSYNVSVANGIILYEFYRQRVILD